MESDQETREIMWVHEHQTNWGYPNDCHYWRPSFVKQEIGTMYIIRHEKEKEYFVNYWQDSSWGDSIAGPFESLEVAKVAYLLLR